MLSSLSWRQRYAMRRAEQRRRALSLTPLRLLLALCLVTFLTSCCSPEPTLGPRPTLPAGRPTTESDALTKRHLGKWKPDPTNPTTYRIEKRELIDVLLNRGQWRAYALAMEAAGDWK